MKSELQIGETLATGAFFPLSQLLFDLDWSILKEEELKSSLLLHL
jgi:hypothetical protein